MSLYGSGLYGSGLFGFLGGGVGPEWQPLFQVLVAFNNSVFDDPALITTVASPGGTLGANNVWTDISAFVRDNCDTNRGRQHETDRFQQGTLTLNLDNRSGWFDPWNTSSPYTGLVLPGKPVRLQATDPNTSTVTALFTGVTDVWTTGWADPRGSITSLSCVDWFAYMNNLYLSTPLYPNTVLADTPNVYLRLGDVVTASTLYDSSANHYVGAFPTGTVVLGQAGAIQNNVGTGADFANGGTTPVGSAVTPAAGGITGTTWTFECWYKSSSWTATGAGNILYYQFDSSGSNALQVQVTGPTFGTSGLAWVTHTNVSGNTLTFDTTAPIPADGNWHHLACTSAAVWYLDGQPVATTVLVNTGMTAHTPVRAVLASTNTAASWPGMLQEVALYPTALSAGRLATHYNNATAPVEQSGPRITRICSWMGIPTGNATIDTGKSAVQAITQATTTTTALTYEQTVEQTEDGAFFILGSGQVRFMSRDTVYTTLTSTVTFGDNGGAEIPFELNPTIATDTLDQYVQAILQRNNGNPQTADSGLLGKQYQASGLLQTSDAEVLGEAEWLLAQFDITPKPRIRSITIHPFVTPTGTATTAILGLEIGSVVTVNRHRLPGAGTVFSQVCNVEGINHHVYPATGDWTIDLQLTPLPPTRPWILGTSQLGVDTTLFF